MIAEKKFGRTLDKEDIILYTLKNENGIQVDVMNYGAILVNLFVPNKDGEVADVVLGYDQVKDYFVNGSCFGATMGPIANRTEKGSFEIDGTTYNLVINDNDNNLHSHGDLGLHKKLWTANKLEDENAVEFTCHCSDGEIGFPGNRVFKVTYKLTQDNAIEIHYYASTDKKTIVNMTNHTYFNLKGHDSDTTVEDVKVWMKASNYTKVRLGAIPTGEIAPVAGTPFDFTQMKRVSDSINEEFVQLALVKGYDHNFVVDDYEPGKLQKVAEAVDETAGRAFEVYTDLPGIQFYTGNNMVPEFGKAGAYYPNRGGICFETQFFPNSARQEGFYKPVVVPEKPFTSVTVYKFI